MAYSAMKAAAARVTRLGSRPGSVRRAAHAASRHLSPAWSAMKAAPTLAHSCCDRQPQMPMCGRAIGDGQVAHCGAPDLRNVSDQERHHAQDRAVN